MSSNTVTIAAALIGSAPGWVGLYVANRRALAKQTRSLTEHIDAKHEAVLATVAASRPGAAAPPEGPARIGDDAAARDAATRTTAPDH